MKKAGVMDVVPAHQVPELAHVLPDYNLVKLTHTHALVESYQPTVLRPQPGQTFTIHGDPFQVERVDPPGKQVVLLSFSARRMVSFVLENGPLPVKGLRFFTVEARQEVRLPFYAANGRTVVACYELMESIEDRRPKVFKGDFVYVFDNWLHRRRAA